jgi:hypothetical protein
VSHQIFGAAAFSQETYQDAVQPFIDRLVDLLPGWKSELMTRPRCVVQVQFMLIAMIIYHAMALDFPPWVLKDLSKICWNYLLD